MTSRRSSRRRPRSTARRRSIAGVYWNRLAPRDAAAGGSDGDVRAEARRQVDGHALPLGLRLRLALQHVPRSTACRPAPSAIPASPRCSRPRWPGADRLSLLRRRSDGRPHVLAHLPGAPPRDRDGAAAPRRPEPRPPSCRTADAARSLHGRSELGLDTLTPGSRHNPTHASSMTTDTNPAPPFGTYLLTAALGEDALGRVYRAHPRIGRPPLRPAAGPRDRRSSRRSRSSTPSRRTARSTRSSRTRRSRAASTWTPSRAFRISRGASRTGARSTR